MSVLELKWGYTVKYAMVVGSQTQTEHNKRNRDKRVMSQYKCVYSLTQEASHLMVVRSGLLAVRSGTTIYSTIPNSQNDAKPPSVYSAAAPRLFIIQSI